MKTRVVCVAALVAIAVGVCTSSEKRAETRGSLEEFRLYTKCVGVSLVVEHKSQGAEETALKREEIVAAVESRLRLLAIGHMEPFEDRHKGATRGSP